MTFLRDQYSRLATRDVRASLAVALRRHLEGLTFHNPGLFQFAEVFEEWPSYVNRYIPPSACVLPVSWKYDSSNFSPFLMEDTWEPSGQQGFGLYKMAEIDVELEVSVRTNSVSEREAITLGVEESFHAPTLTMDPIAGSRYGTILPLPEYYDLTGRFALAGARVVDDEDHAMREQRDIVFTVSAQAAQVVVGPVYPLNATVRIVQVPPSVLSIADDP